MLAMPSRTRISPHSTPRDFTAEWKWDGIRVQAVSGREATARLARLYSRTGEDITGAFPICCRRCTSRRDRRRTAGAARRPRAAFNVLQQRLNRKSVNAEADEEFPDPSARLRSARRRRRRLRELPFAERRARLEAFIAARRPRIDLSPLMPFATWDELAAARADPAAAGAGEMPRPSKA